MPENDASSSNSTKKEEDHNACSDEDELRLTLAPCNERSHFKIPRIVRDTPVDLKKSPPINCELSLICTPNNLHDQYLQNVPSQKQPLPCPVQQPVNDGQPEKLGYGIPMILEMQEDLCPQGFQLQSMVSIGRRGTEDSHNCTSTTSRESTTRPGVLLVSHSRTGEMEENDCTTTTNATRSEGFHGKPFFSIGYSASRAGFESGGKAVSHDQQMPHPHYPVGTLQDPEAELVRCHPRSKVARLNNRKLRGNGKDAHVPNLFAWGTNERGKVKSLEDLQSRGVTVISGEVQCKQCGKRSTIEYDLMVEFEKIAVYLRLDGQDLNQRAPSKWMSPSLRRCTACKKKGTLKPLISGKKKSINWLFLFLGEMLGCCTLQQLKYFCKHNSTNRNGAKDRVLFRTYLILCKQLDPNTNWSFLTTY